MHTIPLIELKNLRKKIQIVHHHALNSIYTYNFLKRPETATLTESWLIENRCIKISTALKSPCSIN